MKRYFMLFISIIIVAVAISSTNAAYYQKQELDTDSIELVYPTATPIPDPTATPTPSWTGEYELIISPLNIYRTGSVLFLESSQVHFTIKNNSSSDIYDWHVSFDLESYLSNINNAFLRSLGGTRYMMEAYEYRNHIAKNSSYSVQGKIQTYQLGTVNNSNYIRNNYPDFEMLAFTNPVLEIATDRYGGTMRKLQANQFKITYQKPPQSQYQNYALELYDLFKIERPGLSK